MGEKPKFKNIFFVGIVSILLAIPSLVNSGELEYEFTKEALRAQNPATELKFKSYQINGATIIVSGKHGNQLSENEEMQLNKSLGPIVQENSTIIIEFSYIDGECFGKIRDFYEVSDVRRQAEDVAYGLVPAELRVETRRLPQRGAVAPAWRRAGNVPADGARFS